MEEKSNRLLRVIKDSLAVVVVTGLLVSSFSAVYAEPYISANRLDNKKEISTLVQGSQLLKCSVAVVDTMIDVYRLTVDDKHVLFFETEKEAEDTLDRLKASYLSDNENTQSVSFVEDVEIKADSVSIYDFDTFASADEAIDYIKTGTLEKEVYIIEKGDSLYSIAHNHDMTLDDLYAANPGLNEDSIIHIDDEINLLAPMPLINVKVVEVEVDSQVVDYDVIKKPTDDLYEDDSQVKVEGSVGQSQVESIVVYINGREASRKVVTENIISEPVTEIQLVGTAKRPVGTATGSFQRPMYNYIITSPFGPRGGGFHTGIDLATSIGTSVYAADGGTVTYAGWRSSYGNLVIIDHGNGKETYYAHLSKVNVSVGQGVSQGDNIAASGNTGRSTGPHLHFEVRVGGEAVNPTNYVGL